jgi:serine protease Do
MKNRLSITCEKFVSALLLLGLLTCLNTAALAAKPGEDQTKLPAPSTTAQKLYSSVRNDLLQLRILLRNGRAQSSVGSGFLIGTGNLVVTNYHVVSPCAPGMARGA